MPRAMAASHKVSVYDINRRSALRALRRADPVMARLIDAVGPLRLERGDLTSPFDALAHAISHQQLTAKAAMTILGRVRALFPEHTHLRPEAILDISVE